MIGERFLIKYLSNPPGFAKEGKSGFIPLLAKLIITHKSTKPYGKRL